MTTYTKLSEADLEFVASEYGLSTIGSVNPFGQGSENSNFLLVTDDAQHVLTICESKSIEAVDVLVKTLRYLEQHGFQTTKIIPTQSGKSSSWLNGKPILLKSYLPGEVLDPMPLSSLESLGEAMGRLHALPTPDFLPRQIAYGIQTFGTLRDAYGKPHPFLDWLESTAENTREYLTDTMPTSLIHGDIFADNVVHVDGSGPVIMDFEEAAIYYRMFDVGMALVGTCRNAIEQGDRQDGKHRIDAAAREKLMTGYSRVIEICPEELEALPAFTSYAAAAMAAWRFRQFNILHPELGKQDHYKELQLVAITTQISN